MNTFEEALADRLDTLSLMTAWSDLGIAPDPLDRITGKRFLPIIMDTLREVQRTQYDLREHAMTLLTDCGWMHVGVRPSPLSTARMRHHIEQIQTSIQTHEQYDENDFTGTRPSSKG